MQSSHITKALEASGLTVEDALQRIDETVKRLTDLADITPTPEGFESKNVISLPYDRKSALVIDLEKFEKYAKAFIKTAFVADSQIKYLDNYSGGVSLTPMRDFDEPNELTNSSAVPFMEVNKTDYLVEQVEIGLFVICGLNRSGKSVIANDVLNPDVRIRHGEPKEDRFDLHPQAVRAARFTSALFGCLVFGSIGLTSAIDSLKNEAYRIDGAAGEGGIQPQLVLILSDLSLIASFLHAPIIALVNPMVNEDAMRKFANQADSNVSAYIYMKRTDDDKASVAEAFVRMNGNRVSISDQLSDRLNNHFKTRANELVKSASTGFNNFEPSHAGQKFTISTSASANTTPFAQPNGGKASVNDTALPVLNQQRNKSVVDEETFDDMEQEPVIVSHRL
jgi:hypothetical protein